ncbi:MAG: EthD domain-containing protein [Myxococcota bacterium]|nr:EthD domain-containing protein [Myxococcota bacterium]
MRTVAFLQRRPDLSRDAFREHYEGQHVPLALPHLRGLQFYVRNHVQFDSDAGAPPFDAISEFEYESPEAFDAMSTVIQSKDGNDIREDELRFMHKPGNSFFSSALAATGAGTRPEPGSGYKVMAVLQSTAEEKREALAARAYNAAASIETSGAAIASQIDVGLVGDPLGPAAFDVVLHLWYPDGADVRVAVETLRDVLSGASIFHCFGVLECNTPVLERDR